MYYLKLFLVVVIAWQTPEPSRLQTTEQQHESRCTVLTFPAYNTVKLMYRCAAKYFLH